MYSKSFFKALACGVAGGAIAGCAATSNGTGSADRFTFEPDVELPDQDGYYVVPRTRERVYSRPTRRAPEIGKIYSTQTSPRVVEVFSVKEQEYSNWWEVEHEGRKGYISTPKIESLRPYIPTALPPSMDQFNGYEDDRLLITGVEPSRPNTAGGVDIQVGAMNPDSGEKLKYIRYWVSPFNAVGDKVQGETRRRDEAALRVTGPVEADGDEDWSTWKNVFYNSSIVCAEINKVEITYMDDSRDTWVGDELKEIILAHMQNDCSYQG